MNLKQHIHEVENWPEAGISFKDISPILENENLLNAALDKMHNDLRPQYWAGIESRGFIFATALAQKFGGGVLLIRKKGKLPPPVFSQEYSLEYGTDTIEMRPGDGSVVLVDDVLATGGTLKAGYDLCQNAGYNILACSVLIELTDVKQKHHVIDNHPVFSVIKY